MRLQSLPFRLARSPAVYRVVPGLRILLLVVAMSLPNACDPGYAKYFAVAATPSGVPDSSINVAFNLVNRIAERHGLTPWRPTDAEHNWRTCVGLNSLRVCGKTIQGEAQFMIAEYGRPRPKSDSLRRELWDSLRTTFGPAAVRECRWRASATDSRLDGCPPVQTVETR